MHQGHLAYTGTNYCDVGCCGVSCCCVVGAPVVLVCCPAIDWDVLYIKERLAEPGGLPPAQGQAIPMFFWLARQMLCFYYYNYHGCYLFLLCFPQVRISNARAFIACAGGGVCGVG